MSEKLVKKMRRACRSGTAVNGKTAIIKDKGVMELCVDGQTMVMECLVLSHTVLIPRFELILGMDVIRRLGSVLITEDSRAVFE